MDNSVQKLMQISTPKTFRDGEYVCYEGQPGDEMYVILKGCVGVYITSAVNTQTEVARINSGNFFGEMAIFDNLPRSASCVALEETICVAINRNMLPRFIETCPEMTAKLLENMSGRIRKLNDDLYKSDNYITRVNDSAFALPKPYDFSHNVEEPYHDMGFVESLLGTCPICGKVLPVLNVKRRNLTIIKTDKDGRKRYKECDPLWFDVWGCPYCHYSNHYLSFFRVMPFNRDTIKQLLTEKHDPVIEQSTFLKTPFDQLVLKYLQAISINETVNSENKLLPGTLWLNLYWLFCDAGDEEMRKYCAEKAAGNLIKVFENAEKNIPDEYSRQSLAMTLAYLLNEIGRSSEAVKYCETAFKLSDGKIKLNAYALKEQIIQKK